MLRHLVTLFFTLALFLTSATPSLAVTNSQQSGLFDQNKFCFSAHEELKAIFDLDEIKEDAEAAQLFAEAGFRAAGDIAAAVAAIADGDIAAGAGAAALNEFLLPYIVEALKGTDLGPLDKDAILILASQAVGGLVGGNNGAAITGLATEHNYLNHKLALEREVAKQNCAEDDSAACERVKELDRLDEENDRALRSACDANPSSQECLARITDLAYSINLFRDSLDPVNLGAASRALDLDYFEALRVVNSGGGALSPAYGGMVEELEESLAILNEYKLAFDQVKDLRSKEQLLEMIGHAINLGTGILGARTLLAPKGAGGGSGATNTGGPWTATDKLTTPQNAFKHWGKHKSEFPELQNSVQYVKAAKSFLQKPPAGTLTKTRPNGDVLRFDPATNTFGVMAKDGTPRTMFRPKKGIEYWNRQ